MIGMQGKFIIGAIALAALTPAAAHAGAPAKQPSCSKAEPPQSAQQRPQQAQPRTRPAWCPATRTIPPIVDPTPTFLL